MEAEIKAGSLVRYRASRKGPFGSHIFTVSYVGKLGDGTNVAWLEGKVGCVALWALQEVAT